jgi:Ca2+/H+ antiporter
MDNCMCVCLWVDVVFRYQSTESLATGRSSHTVSIGGPDLILFILCFAIEVVSQSNTDGSLFWFQTRENTSLRKTRCKGLRNKFITNVQREMELYWRLIKLLHLTIYVSNLAELIVWSLLKAHPHKHPRPHPHA